MKAKFRLLGKANPYPQTYNPCILSSQELYSLIVPMHVPSISPYWIIPISIYSCLSISRLKKKESSHIPFQLLLHSFVPFITEIIYIYLDFHFLISDSFLKPWQLGFHSP